MTKRGRWPIQLLAFLEVLLCAQIQDRPEMGCGRLVLQLARWGTMTHFAQTSGTEPRAPKDKVTGLQRGLDLLHGDMSE